MTDTKSKKEIVLSWYPQIKNQIDSCVSKKFVIRIDNLIYNRFKEPIVKNSHLCDYFKFTDADSLLNIIWSYGYSKNRTFNLIEKKDL